MNDIVRQRLRSLIAQHGPELCNDLGRCEGLLRDYCGQWKGEVYVLMCALRGRVHLDLLHQPVSVPRRLLIQRLADRLHEDFLLPADVALWAVESWEMALNGQQSVRVGEGAPDSSAFVECFNRNGGEAEVGKPVGLVNRSGFGWRQDFEHGQVGGAGGRGSILLRDGAHRAYWVHGEIWKEWTEKLHGVEGRLGFPVLLDESRCVDESGRAMYISFFEHGAISYRSESGTCVLEGPILARWFEMGGIGSSLGWPLFNQDSQSEYGTGYKLQGFEEGAIYLHAGGSKAGRAFVCSGPVFELYNAIGDYYGNVRNQEHYDYLLFRLGIPVSDEMEGGYSTVSNTPYRCMLFENGVIFRHLDGPHKDRCYALWGASAAKYGRVLNSDVDSIQQHPWLGLPVSKGGIGELFARKDDWPGGSEWYVHFEAGLICAIGGDDKQMYAIHKLIIQKYAGLTLSEQLKLGGPTGDTYGWLDGLRSDFEHGYIECRFNEDIVHYHQQEEAQR